MGFSGAGDGRRGAAAHPFFQLFFATPPFFSSKRLDGKEGKRGRGGVGERNIDARLPLVRFLGGGRRRLTLIFLEKKRET